jgi:hypothetical protein
MLPGWGFATDGCDWCPVGQHSAGGYLRTCTRCDNYYDFPEHAQWVVSSIKGESCMWQCDVGYFEERCVPCSVHMPNVYQSHNVSEDTDPVRGGDTYVNGVCVLTCG